MIISESTINPDLFFNLEGLDYEKNVYTVFYNNRELDSSGNIIQDKIKVGLRNKSDFNQVLVHPIEIGDWNDGAFSTLNDLLVFILPLVGFNNGGGAGTVEIFQTVDTFADLVDGEEVGQLSVVKNSTGLPFINLKDAGFYTWTGTVWKSDDGEIINKISQNVIDIQSKADINHTHTKSDITDFNEADYATAAQGAKADSAIQDETDPIFQASEASNFVAGDKTNLDNQSGTNTGDETTTTIQTKRPIKTINGNSLEGVGDVVIPDNVGAEELDDLTDVNTQTVFPKAGWVLKYDGSLYVPSMREIVNSKNLVTNDFNAFPSTKISQNFNFQRVGTYSLTVYFSWSHNSTGNDFRANLIFDGVGVGALNNTEIFEIEPKDSAGNDADGRGTNQKLIFSQKYFVDVTTTGNKLVELTFQPQVDFVISSMWDATIVVEEEFGVINN